MDSRWLREFREKMKPRGAGAELARKLGVKQSTITHLKAGVGSIAIVLAASNHLAIAPPAGVMPDAADAQERRLIDLYRRMREAGATDRDIDQFLDDTEETVQRLEAARRKRDEAAAEASRAWSHRRRESHPPRA